MEDGEPFVRWALGAVPGSRRVGFRAPPSEPGVHLSLCTGLSIDVDREVRGLRAIRA